MSLVSAVVSTTGRKTFRLTDVWRSTNGISDWKFQRSQLWRSRLWYYIQLHNTSSIFTQLSYTDRIIREVIDIEFQPNDMNREGGFCLCMYWEPLACSLEDRWQLSSKRLIPPPDHVDPHTLPPIWAPTTPKPFFPTPISLCYFALSPTAFLRVNTPLLSQSPRFSAHHTFTTSPLDEIFALAALFRAEASCSSIVSYWFTLLCEEQARTDEIFCIPTGSLCSVTEPIGTD